MLKKSRRTLSLVLALVMVCASMSVMSFAADPRDVYWFEGSSSLITMETTSASGVNNITTARVEFSGNWHEYDGTFFWNAISLNVSTTLDPSDLTWYVDGNIWDFTRTIHVVHQGFSTSPYDVYRIEVSFVEDGVSIRYYAVSNNQKVGPYYSVSTTCDFELM